MEILATNTYDDLFILGLTIILVGIALGIIFGVGSGTPILGVIIAVPLVLTGTDIAQEEGDVTYEAIVTDWNEVYEQGYEVVNRNGQIVTLKKVEED